MRIAILLGVSKYKNLSDLPACEADMDLIEKLLRVTRNYDKILRLSEIKPTAQIKEQATNWVRELEIAEIAVDECFFYYTGHGEFFQDEFYFPLNDFDSNRRQQTSLANSELDSWLRELKPRMMVKVVDACQSGMLYVKDGSERFEKYLNETKNNFKNCYFMFSSSNQESSYQDNSFSFFTKSFALAFANHKSSSIRYRDIVDFIADDFSDQIGQTPFFVTQANHTEVFSDLTKEIREVVRMLISPNNNEQKESTNELISPQEDNQLPLSLKQIIQRDAERYRNEDEVKALFQKLKDLIENFVYPNDLTDLYETNFEFGVKTSEIPSQVAIGKWLEKNDHNFFAKPIYVEKKQETLDPYSTLSYAVAVAATVMTLPPEIDGFQNTTNLPFLFVEIRLKPKFPNIPWRVSFIVFLVSKTSMRFFYFFANLMEKNWRELELEKEMKWQTKQIEIKDVEAVLSTVSEIIDSFISSSLSLIRERFGFNEN